MLKSMTGYGISVTETPDFVIKAEIKTLNSKFFEFKIRLPNNFSDKEAEIKNLIESSLSRGKIDMIINMRYSGIAKYRKNIDKELASSYFNEINELCDELQVNHLKSIEPVLNLPEIFTNSINDNEPNEEEYRKLIACIDEAIRKTDEFRITEGQRLEKEINVYLKSIDIQTGEIELTREERIVKIREKIFLRLSELKLSEINQERFEQELVYYIEKLDISEEIDRLKSHILHFRQCLDENDSGRKLGFIAQEMGREINTIGSKANDYGIQQKVVLMKNELEKIRQQLANIL